MVLKPKTFNPEVIPLAKSARDEPFIGIPRTRLFSHKGILQDAVFYILKGQVRMTMVSSQGKEAVIAIYGAKNFFGHRCLTGVPHRITTVTTLTESVIMRIQASEAFDTAIREEPAFAELFIAHLLDRSIRIELFLIDQLFNSSERRLARLLVLLANLDKGGKLDPAVVKINQEILAEKIGTTRARVSHFMNKFKKLGYIDYKGEIRVHRSLSSLILHEQPPDPHGPPQIKT